MNCNESTTLIAAYADGETDGLRGHAIEKHLRGCADCTAARARCSRCGRDSHARSPYFAAPPALRARVLALPSPTQRRRRSLRWTRCGTGGDGWPAARWPAARPPCSHGSSAPRSSTGTPTTDSPSRRSRRTSGDARRPSAAVASSDQHTVKPWLSARLDYSPPVRDLAGEGFRSPAASSTMLGQRPVATLVYRYRLHTIDVFVRPLSGARAPLGMRTVRGFNVAHATGAQMEWTAVSDVDADVLSAFVGVLARGGN